MQTKTIFTYIQTLSFMRTAYEYKATLYGTMYNRLKLFREKKWWMQQKEYSLSIYISEYIIWNIDENAHKFESWNPLLFFQGIVF